MSPSSAYGQSIVLEAVRLNICLNENVCHLKRLNTLSIEVDNVLLLLAITVLKLGGFKNTPLRQTQSLYIRKEIKYI